MNEASGADWESVAFHHARAEVWALEPPRLPTKAEAGKYLMQPESQQSAEADLDDEEEEEEEEEEEDEGQEAGREGMKGEEDKGAGVGTVENVDGNMDEEIDDNMEIDPDIDNSPSLRASERFVFDWSHGDTVQSSKWPTGPTYLASEDPVDMHRELASAITPPGKAMLVAVDTKQEEQLEHLEFYTSYLDEYDLKGHLDHLIDVGNIDDIYDLLRRLPLAGPADYMILGFSAGELDFRYVGWSDEVYMRTVSHQARIATQDTSQLVYRLAMDLMKKPDPKIIHLPLVRFDQPSPALKAFSEAVFVNIFATYLDDDLLVASRALYDDLPAPSELADGANGNPAHFAPASSASSSSPPHGILDKAWQYHLKVVPALTCKMASAVYTNDLAAAQSLHGMMEHMSTSIYNHLGERLARGDLIYRLKSDEVLKTVLK